MSLSEGMIRYQSPSILSMDIGVYLAVKAVYKGQ